MAEARAGRPWFWWGYVLVWLAAAVVYAGALTIQGESPLDRLVWGLILVSVAGGLGVGVWALTGLVPWPHARRGRFAAVHAAVACWYAALFAVGNHVPELVLHGPRSAVEGLMNSPERGWSVLGGFLLYALTAAAAYAVRAGRALREREVALLRAEGEAARAQLAVVRAQLNPHFLFNALHTVAALVQEEPSAAEDALEQLGALLRYALDGVEFDQVALADEWEFVRNYVALEQMRLGERLRVETRIADGALDVEVPSFVLQPLVENAIRHGVAPRVEGGVVTIRAEIVAASLVLDVADDGGGASPERVWSSSGLGLRSLRRRLEARYGAGAALDVRTAPGAGFDVTVRLPVGAARVSERGPAAARAADVQA